VTGKHRGGCFVCVPYLTGVVCHNKVTFKDLLLTTVKEQ
jgi:hypothetical protein